MIINMQKVIYVPPWDSFGGDDNVVLHFGKPVVLGTVSGTSGTDITAISSNIPGMDGVYLSDIRVEPAQIKASVNVHGNSREEMYKNRFELIRCLTPKATPGTLYYQNDYISAKIGAVPEASPRFVSRIKNYNAAEITFFCPSPFWESLDEKQVRIAWIGNAFEFPIAIEPKMKFGVIQSKEKVNIETAQNTSVIITVSAPATDPIKISNNTTGQIIELEHSLSGSEKLIINTKRGAKSVTLVHNDGTREDAFHYITPDSELFELVPGENELEYANWNENEPTRVEIAFCELHSGV